MQYAELEKEASIGSQTGKLNTGNIKRQLYHVGAVLGGLYSSCLRQMAARGVLY